MCDEQRLRSACAYALSDQSICSSLEYYMNVKLLTEHQLEFLCFCSVLCLLCLCARLFICALWPPAGKGLTSWLSFVVSAVSLSLSHWYPGSGVILDCIDF